LNQCKYKEIQKRLPIENKSQDVVNNLQNMMNSEKFAGTIFGIGKQPFFCMWASNLQLQVYNLTGKLGVSSISCDSTGSVVEKITCNNRTSKEILLYQIVAIIPNVTETAIVCQMLSEKHSLPQVEYWLCEFLRKGAHIPKIATSDFSFTLLGAMSKAFNGTSFEIYNKTCMLLLLGEKNVINPQTYVRVDYAHFVRAVSKWPCLKNQPKRQREFFIHSFALLAHLETLKDATDIFKCIICTISLAKTTGKATNDDDTPIEYMKKKNEG
jgi:hypothetical protein